MEISTIIGDIVKGISITLSSISAFRNVFTYKGEDMSVAGDDDAKPQKSAQSTFDKYWDELDEENKKELNANWQSIQSELEELKEDHLQKHHLDVVLSRTLEARHKKPISNATMYYDGIKKVKYIGWLAAPAINFIYSRGFGLMLSMIGIGLMFTSPLGIVAGAIGAAFAAAVIIYDISSEIQRAKNIEGIQRKTELLDQIKQNRELSKELFRNLQDKELGSLMNGFMKEKLLDMQYMYIKRGFDKTNTEGASASYAAARTLAKNLAPYVFGLTVSILLFSPFAFTTTMLGMVMGYASATRGEYEYRKKERDGKAYNEAQSKLIGIRPDANPQDLEQLLKLERALYRAAKMVAEIKKDNPDISPDQVQSIFNKVFEREMNMRTVEWREPSIFKRVLTYFSSIFSWKDASLALTPALKNSKIAGAYQPQSEAQQQAEDFHTKRQIRDEILTPSLTPTQQPEEQVNKTLTQSVELVDASAQKEEPGSTVYGTEFKNNEQGETSKGPKSFSNWHDEFKPKASHVAAATTSHGTPSTHR